MYNFFIGMINQIIKGFSVVINSILNLLPNSPFSFENTIDNNILRWLATIIDISGIIQIFSAFISILAVYYVYQIVMRWVKVIN